MTNNTREMLEAKIEKLEAEVRMLNMEIEYQSDTRDIESRILDQIADLMREREEVQEDED